nr:MAG TPA: hypothetical protein [Caudoviricetes sp.]
MPIQNVPEPKFYFRCQPSFQSFLTSFNRTAPRNYFLTAPPLQSTPTKKRSSLPTTPKL